nr:MAG TPA_asm: hypothetical protein [Caudoviricetes sp.]
MFISNSFKYWSIWIIAMRIGIGNSQTCFDRQYASV